jgi:hypothetical protein
MAKQMKHSPVATELKKEYLREHLESIKSLVRRFISELHPPEPLAPNERAWGWQSLYRPPSENNPDDNHMLRRHLKSRALWRHYRNWEQKLEGIWQLIQQVRLIAEDRKNQLSENGKWKFTDESAPLALCKAFDIALGRPLNLQFKLPEDQLGLSYGAFRIEESAKTSEARLLIEEKYRKFIHYLSETSTMIELANSWLQASQLELQVSSLAEDALKSGDIFYMCRFCRQLWA